MTIAGPPPPQPLPPITFNPVHPDFSALSWNPSDAEVTRILKHDLYGNRYNNVPTVVIPVPTIWPRWATVIGVLVPLGLVLSAIASFASGSALGNILAAVFFILADVLALAALGLHAIIRYLGRTSAEGYRRVKLERLAVDNGLTFVERGTPPQFPGCIFTTGTTTPYVHSQFSSTAPNTVIFGNYYPISTLADGPMLIAAPSPGKAWGFLAIRLQRSLPNLLLVSTTREPGDMFLPVSPNPREALSLEGDFDNYFTLYCPAQFEQDALYVITPDLMALLIDQATPFDVEIAEDWMFFYSRIPFDMLDRSMYERLFDILLTIGGKVGHQTSHYTTTVVANPRLEPRARALRSFLSRPLGLGTVLIVVNVVGLALLALQAFGR